MVNNYDAVLLALSAFIVANAPAGAEREVAHMQAKLAEGCSTDYINLEFRPARDTGCTLYVRVESPEGKYDSKRIVDEEGNRWYAYVVKCEVSWSSWGSASAETTQRRLAVMTEVTRFACEVEHAFSEVFYRLEATAAEIKEQAMTHAKECAVAQVERLVKANAKGVKVGQEKVVPVPGADFTSVCPLEVERTESGRHFKYRATATSREGFAFVRTA